MYTRDGSQPLHESALLVFICVNLRHLRIPPEKFGYDFHLKDKLDFSLIDRLFRVDSYRLRIKRKLWVLWVHFL